MRILIVILAAAFGLSACQPETTSKPKPVSPSAVVSSTIATAKTATPVRYMCGELPVKVVFLEQDAVSVEAAEATYRLLSVKASAGQRYMTPKGISPTAEFWNKGREAELSLGGVALPACTLNQPAPHDSIKDGVWQVVEIDGQAPIGTQPLTLRFGQDGNLGGFSGCNQFSGPYTVAAQSLKIGPMVSTMMACGETVLNQQELRYLDLLDDMNQMARPDGERLVLQDGHGRVIRLVRMAED